MALAPRVPVPSVASSPARFEIVWRLVSPVDDAWATVSACVALLPYCWIWLRSSSSVRAVLKDEGSSSGFVIFWPVETSVCRLACWLLNESIWRMMASVVLSEATRMAGLRGYGSERVDGGVDEAVDRLEDLGRGLIGALVHEEVGHLLVERDAGK